MWSTLIGPLARLVESLVTRAPPLRADIRLHVEQQALYASNGYRPSPFRGVRTSPRGFTGQGLPDWASLFLRIRIVNRGCEEGKLDWSLDQSNTKLPPLFDNDRIEADFPFLRPIPGRNNDRVADIYLDALLAEEDPRGFARALKDLAESKKQYQVVISYRTKRVDGDSKRRKLRIRGDFKRFHQDVLKHWEGFGFRDLVQLARLDDS